MNLNKDVNLSYWELKHYFKRYDLIVIGSGIVGLSTAISFKHKHKKARVLVLERGVLPNGASSRNAGFACFGSAGELLDDLSKMPEDVVWQTVEMRWNGLKMLRKRLGDKNINYQALGGYELFNDNDAFNLCLEQTTLLNSQLKQIIGKPLCFTPASTKGKIFRNVTGVLLNQYEGQLDTGLMMLSLLKQASQHDITILNSINVDSVVDCGNKVEATCNIGIFNASKLVVATNGFAKNLLRLTNIKPARAQVLVTSVIKNLKIKGAYHFDKGYYYFRNVDNRVLFGGGRNLDLVGETTDIHGLNPRIQKHLNYLLRNMILPGVDFKVEKRWSGIMGVGNEKKPIIAEVSPNILAAVRMGGMGIAIGTWVGEKAAQTIL